MLTPENTATLRRAAYRSQNRRTDEPRAVVTFSGGPLDGIRLRVLQREALSPSLGFCTVTDGSLIDSRTLVFGLGCGSKKRALASISRQIEEIRPGWARTFKCSSCDRKFSMAARSMLSMFT